MIGQCVKHLTQSPARCGCALRRGACFCLAIAVLYLVRLWRMMALQRRAKVKPHSLAASRYNSFSAGAEDGTPCTQSSAVLRGAYCAVGAGGGGA